MSSADEDAECAQPSNSQYSNGTAQLTAELQLPNSLNTESSSDFPQSIQEDMGHGDTPEDVLVQTNVMAYGTGEDTTSLRDDEVFPLTSDSESTIDDHESHISHAPTHVSYPILSPLPEEVISGYKEKGGGGSFVFLEDDPVLHLPLLTTRIEKPELFAELRQEETKLNKEEDTLEETLQPVSPTINLRAFGAQGNSDQSPHIPVRATHSEDFKYPALPDASVEEELAIQDGESPDELSLDLETTETFVFGNFNPDSTTTLLEDDKAILRSFLNRAAASKANKTAIIHRRESIQNRRDSDAVRHALASPRQVLEEKDVNLSPQRNLGASESSQSLDATLYSPLTKRSAQDSEIDISLTLLAPDDKAEDELSRVDTQTGSPRRRSTRARTQLSLLPTANTPVLTATIPNKIPVRTDGGERVLLNRTEAQQLADFVRKNTRKNKGGSIPASQRLVKLKMETLATNIDGSSSPSSDSLREIKEGDKAVRWRENLVEFSSSTATVDLESSSSETTISKVSILSQQTTDTMDKKQATPRLRRLRGLGAANGTPARNLLSSTLLPDEIEEERTAAVDNTAVVRTRAEEIPLKKEKKSKIQPPKKLTLNPTVVSLSGLPVLVGKENTSQLLSPAKKLSGRGKIPVPAASMVNVAVGTKLVKRARAARKM